VWPSQLKVLEVMEDGDNPLCQVDARFDSTNDSSEIKCCKHGDRESSGLLAWRPSRLSSFKGLKAVSRHMKEKFQALEPWAVLADATSMKMAASLHM
jgi:hypothetical protein